MCTRLLCLITSMIVSLGSAASCLALDSTWTITGQVRPRMEYRNGYRNLLPPATSDGVVFISQRTRIGVLYKGEAKAKAFVQVQDVRTWGDEKNTSSDATADQFDLHQGYLDLTPSETWTFRIGRQEIAYDEERLIGSGNWNQSGRSHDAIRVMWQRGPTSVHAAWAHHEREEPIKWSPYTNSANYQDLALWRLSSTNTRGGANVLLIFDSYDSRYASSPSNRWTGGIYGKLKLAGSELRGETYYQTGRQQSFGPDGSPDFRFDINAFMIGLSASRNAGPVTATLWYDYLSGDSDPTDFRLESFNPLYGTFHKYYGWADYFTSFPNDTHRLGLQDLALKLAFDGPRGAKPQIDVHYFWLSESSSEFGIDSKHLGFEADAMVTIPLLKSVSLSGGASLVLPTKTMRTIKGDADQGHWVWTMLDFNVK